MSPLNPANRAADFKSTSQSTIANRPGRKSQRFRSSGVVHASKSSSRGASKVRVMAISRSLGVVTVNSRGIDRCASGRLSLLASMFLLLRFQFVQQGIESLEISFPELAIAFEPVVGFSEPPRLKTARAALRVAATRNQPGALQHFEMLSKLRAGSSRTARPTPSPMPRPTQAVQDRPPRAIGQRRKDRVELAWCRSSIT